MTFLLIVLLALAVLAIGYLLKKPSVGGAAAKSLAPAPADRRTSAQASTPAATLVAAEPALPAEIPAELAGWRFVGRDELAAQRRWALQTELRNIPRPPLSLHKLLSPELLDSATSIEINDLILGEALIAAKVLARVNSPFYGLRRPVLSIGQAVTFLGLNAVRSISLQYLLDQSFQASSPEHKKVFDTVLSASALAGELCLKLAQRLDWPEQGSLVTQVVLSFLGQLATVSLMPGERSVWIAENGLLERASAEQAQLGLAAAEIGSLLMQEWGLPASLIEEVREIDQILLTPPALMAPQRRTRLALCYLCARLGERLALGSLSDLCAFDPATDSSAELFYLRSYLVLPELARLVEFLHAPELGKSIQQMRLAMRARG